MTAVERPDPVAQGDLADTPFAHALMYVHRHGLSGTLAVWPEAKKDGSRPQGQDRILFSLGTAVAARFRSPQPSLDVGLLPLFERQEGPYAFYEPNYVGEGPGVVTGRVRSLHVLTAGCRRALRRPTVDSVLARLGKNRLRIRTGTSLDDFGFNSSERAFVELVQAEPANADSLLRTWADPELARRVLYVLAVSRSLEPYDPIRSASARPAEAGRTGGSPPRPPRRPPRPPKVSTQIPAAAASTTPNRAPTPKPSLRPSRGADDPRPAPGTTGGAAPSGPTGRGPAPGRVPPPPPAPPRSGPAAVGGPAPTGSDEAGAPRAAVQPPPAVSPSSDASQAGDEGATTGARRVAPAPAPPPAAGPAIATPFSPDDPYPPPASDLSDEHRGIWEELGERLQGLDNKTYFEMLGVDENADDKSVRDRYFEVVKKFHPDRLPPALQPIKAHAERLFRHATEARDTLSDPEKKIRYQRQVRAGGGTPETDRQISNVLQAANLFRKAEVIARRRDWGGTIELLDEAIQLSNEDPDAFALKAWAILQRDSGSPDLPVDEILRLLDRALELDEYHERAHYTRGLLFKRQGHDHYALWHFQRVVSANRRHLDAMREARLAEMRGVKPKKPSPSKAKILTSMLPPSPTAPPPSPGPPTTTSTGGLFSRFFGGPGGKKKP